MQPAVHFYNRTILFQDCSAEAAAAVWSKLRTEKIAYSVKTTNNGPAKPAVRMARSGRMGNFTSGYSVGSAQTIGVPQSWNAEGNANYCYTIYVRKKDLQKAKEVCEIA